MSELRLYGWLSRFGFLNYRTKILLVVFAGIHLPLIALVGYLAFCSGSQWQSMLTPLAITLAVTLGGTGATLWVLHQLLRPVVLTSKALRLYRKCRQKTTLPTRYTDEVGVLMADAGATIDHLDKARDVLEHTDEATGLPNRKKLLQLMEQHAERGLSFYIVIVRLANFSRIAEALDLAQAEAAAGVIATRLKAHAEAGCLLARIAPSDFALFYAQPAERGYVTEKRTDELRALLVSCTQDLSLRSIDVKPNLQCGVAEFTRNGGDESIETLLERAMAAASQATPAKPVILHSPKARQAALDRLSMEQALRQALRQEQFTLYYQPVVDVAAGLIIGAEALIRWHHPEQGLVPLCTFMPVAESSGLIESIDVWVIRQACQQLRRWNTSGLQDMHLAINVSARQFRNPGLCSLVEQAMVEAAIDPSQIELELTETSAMLDLDHTQRMFALLRQLGVHVTIDDFGTGYGSLSYLRRLPFDKLKIDQQFVKNVHRERQGQAICKSLIALSGGFDLGVVSEGVEQAEEVDYLSRLGCRLFQGFFFAKPLPPDEFAAFFESGLVSSCNLKDSPNAASALRA